MTHGTAPGPIRRFVWRHRKSGIIPIMGEGRISNSVTMTEADEWWLNHLFGDLEFELQEWDGEDWFTIPQPANVQPRGTV